MQERIDQYNLQTLFIYHTKPYKKYLLINPVHKSMSQHYVERYQLKSQFIIVMNQQPQVQRHNNILTNQHEMLHEQQAEQRGSSQFQKNYPKNIFIPIIQYLADLGLRQQYELAVGTRQEFQGKNVVSLSLIFKLLAQQWFQNSVNKGILEANISNKILMNSKIKKKLFHLKVARILLRSDALDAKEYKKNVSKQANMIALQLKEDDELFQYPSAIIYLLNFFLHCLKNAFLKQVPNIKQQQQVQFSHESHDRQANSKQQFKNLIKSIINMLNKVKADQQSLDKSYLYISQRISQRAIQINKKYELSQNVPNWEYFIQIVVSKCFQYKREGQKITNSTFNQWILQFKHKTNQFGLIYQSLLPLEGQQKIFTPIIIISPPPE